MENVILDFQGDMRFDAHIENHTITIDASREFGGSEVGPRPKPLMLVALAGCTGMDVASLAKKMRVEIQSLTIEVQAEKSTDMPVVYTSFNVIYRFIAAQTDAEKIKKIVDMSQERYCGVSTMMRQVAPLSYEIFLNDQRL